MKFISNITPSGNLFEECANGNVDAFECASSIYRYIDWLDNVIDRDVAQTAELSAKTSLNLFMMLSFNKFWESNKASLAPILIAGFNSWLDSETAKVNEDFRVKVAADVLKGYFMETFYHISFLTGGYDLMRTISKKWRGFDFDCGLADPRALTPLPELKPREWKFPEDHGSHEDHAVEWWYFSGLLEEDKKCGRIGFHICKFRIGEVIHTHLSLFSPKTGQLKAVQKIGNGAVMDFSLPGRIVLSGIMDDVFFHLNFKHAREVFLQGINRDGLSVKSDLEGHASQYYSIPHLRTTGVLQIGQDQLKVKGVSWFDHEFGNVLKVPDFKWAFFYAQFESGSFLNGYLMIENGEINPYSRLVYSSAAGVVTDLSSSFVCASLPTIDAPTIFLTVNNQSMTVQTLTEHKPVFHSALGDYLELPCEVDWNGERGIGYLEITS